MAAGGRRSTRRGSAVPPLLRLLQAPRRRVVVGRCRPAGGALGAALAHGCGLRRGTTTMDACCLLCSDDGGQAATDMNGLGRS